MAYNIQDTMYHQDQVTIVKEYEVFVRETFIQENSKGNICPVNPSRILMLTLFFGNEVSYKVGQAVLKYFLFLICVNLEILFLYDSHV